MALPQASPSGFGWDVTLAGDVEAISSPLLQGNLIILLLNLNSQVKILPTSKRTVMAPAQNESQGTNPLLCKRSGYLNRPGSEGWESGPREGGSWNGVAPLRREGKRRQLPSPQARRAGENLDSREDLVYMLGRQGSPRPHQAM